MADHLCVGTTADNVSPVKCPSSFTWGRITVSDDDAGRTKSAKMYVNKVADKVQISLTWNAPTGAETAAILQAFDHEYFYVKYHDPMTNGWTTKEFYHGDFSAPVYYWWDAEGTRYQNVSFDIIER